MIKKNFVTLLGIGLAVALVATGVFYGLFVSNLKSNAQTGKTLVVAAKSLSPGRTLAAEDLKEVPWPSAELPKGSFEKIGEVVGKTLFDGIDEAEPIFATRLAASEKGGRTGAIPEGMRAVSVHVSDSMGVLAMLRAGHKVDVQVLVKRGKEANTLEVRTALEQLEVLSVSPKKESKQGVEELPVVTLLAKPADADILALADSGAKLRLTLRNPLDTGTRPGSTLSLSTVMQQSGVAR